eukprot:GABV01008684.1.p2 GENE.GABV01008684.1~~GABV01008684.1.p2  ORF type:complete len:243 (+),score=67.45 GABV01008684.1:183-911(+)
MVSAPRHNWNSTWPEKNNQSRLEQLRIAQPASAPAASTNTLPIDSNTMDTSSTENLVQEEEEAAEPALSASPQAISPFPSAPTDPNAPPIAIDDSNGSTEQISTENSPEETDTQPLPPSSRVTEADAIVQANSKPDGANIQGTVLYWHPWDGFGWIEPSEPLAGESPPPLLFVGNDELLGDYDRKSLKKGLKVAFQLSVHNQRERVQAISVSLPNGDPPSRPLPAGRPPKSQPANDQKRRTK